jgi:hypothetical protein
VPKIFGYVVAAVLVWMTAGGCQTSSPPSGSEVKDLFGRVQVGMDRQAVEKLLGAPTLFASAGDTTWYLPPPDIGPNESPYAPGSIGIIYSSDGKVVRKELNPQAGRTPGAPVDPVVSVGMTHDQAIAALQQVRAVPFSCTYEIKHPSPSFKAEWFTLPDGLTVQLFSDKKDNALSITVTDVAICNSTLLFCCTGETWYHLQTLRLPAAERTLDEPKTWSYESSMERPVGAYLWQGMSESAAQAMLSRATLKLLTDAPGLTDLPPGRWLRYGLRSLDDNIEIALNFDGQAGREGTLRLILVSAIRRQTGESPAKRVRIECQFVDLGEPLAKLWYRLFDDPWTWKPGKEAEKAALIAKGQQR